MAETRRYKIPAERKFSAVVEETKEEIKNLHITKQIQQLLLVFNGMHTVSSRNKSVSHKTQSNRIADIMKFLKIVDDKFRLKNIYNWQERHYEAVLDVYLNTVPPYKPGTVANFLTNTRILYRWIGKERLLKAKKAEYVKDPVRLQVSEVALRDKSWKARDIDPEDIFMLIEA